MLPVDKQHMEYAFTSGVSFCQLPYFLEYTTCGQVHKLCVYYSRAQTKYGRTLFHSASYV